MSAVKREFYLDVSDACVGVSVFQKFREMTKFRDLVHGTVKHELSLRSWAEGMYSSARSAQQRI
jgi:hypothetical protein